MMGLELGLGLGVVAVAALLVYVPNPFRDRLIETYRIRFNRLKKQVTSPIERELALITGPEHVIEQSQAQVRDLRGTLLHEKNVLMLRQDALAQAEAAYYKAADDKGDSGIDELVALVGEKEQEVAIQAKMVEGVQTAVATACSAVDQARKELRRVQLTVKSDTAKEKATTALESAARVMEAARSITADGGALSEASGEVSRRFEQARARIDTLGSGADSELAKLTNRDEINGLRARLDAKRPK